MLFYTQWFVRYYKYSVSISFQLRKKCIQKSTPQHILPYTYLQLLLCFDAFISISILIHFIYFHFPLFCLLSFFFFFEFLLACLWWENMWDCNCIAAGNPVGDMVSIVVINFERSCTQIPDPFETVSLSLVSMRFLLPSSPSSFSSVSFSSFWYIFFFGGGDDLQCLIVTPLLSSWIQLFLSSIIAY